MSSRCASGSASWWQRVLAAHRRRDEGAGIVEFVLLVVVVFIPLTYGVIAFAVVQRSVFGAVEAARQAGRAVATATSPALAAERAEYAAELAVQAQDVNAEDVTVWFEPRSGQCESPSSSYDPALASGEVFAVCVQVTIRVPLVPEFIDRNTATGRYVVAMDGYR